MLDRPADRAGGDDWTDLLTTGAVDRGTVMTGCSASIECKLRTADPRGRNYWLDQFERGASLRQVVAASGLMISADSGATRP